MTKEWKSKPKERFCWRWFNVGANCCLKRRIWCCTGQKCEALASDVSFLIVKECILRSLPSPYLSTLSSRFVENYPDANVLLTGAVSWFRAFASWRLEQMFVEFSGHREMASFLLEATARRRGEMARPSFVSVRSSPCVLACTRPVFPLSAAGKTHRLRRRTFSVRSSTGAHLAWAGQLLNEACFQDFCTSMQCSVLLTDTVILLSIFSLYSFVDLIWYPLKRSCKNSLKLGAFVLDKQISAFNDKQSLKSIDNTSHHLMRMLHVPSDLIKNSNLQESSTFLKEFFHFFCLWSEGSLIILIGVRPKLLLFVFKTSPLWHL